MRRSDHRGPVWRNVADLGGARGFDQFRSNHHVNLTGHRGQCKDRSPRSEFGQGNSGIFNVIRCRPGSLRDTWDRCTLRQIAGIANGGQGPIRQHAAAFAAERRDQDTFCPGATCGHVAACWRL
jgi:hypothetical protein